MHLLESPRSAQSSCPIFNKQLIEIDLMIFEVFLYLDDTIDNNDDNVQEVEKDTEVCRDLFRLWLVFFIFQDASYNLRIVIFNRTAFRQRCCPNLIQSIILQPGQVGSQTIHLSRFRHIEMLQLGRLLCVIGYLAYEIPRYTASIFTTNLFKSYRPGLIDKIFSKPVQLMMNILQYLTS